MLWGVIALLTPLTPGSWLFFVGLFIIFGKKKTENKLFHLLGRKWFKRLRVKEALEKLPDHK